LAKRNKGKGDLGMTDISYFDRIYATVGGQIFRTQDALKEKARALLRDYDAEQFVAAKDWFFLAQLVRRHPDANQKIGAGIAHFQRRENKREEWAYAPGFWIIRVDGSEEAFSIYDCLRENPPSPEKRFLDKVMSCCRASISETVFEFKNRHFGGRTMARCEVSNVLMSFSEASVDHFGEWPFIRIVDEWLMTVSDSFWSLPVGDDDLGVSFTNPAASADFRRFHDDHATLMVIHKSINSSKGSGGYKMKFEIPLRAASVAA
jgi:hypothetical protein